MLHKFCSRYVLLPIQTLWYKGRYKGFDRVNTGLFLIWTMKVGILWEDTNGSWRWIEADYNWDVFSVGELWMCGLNYWLMLWKLHLSIVLRNGWTIGAWMWKHKLCLHPLILQVTSYNKSGFLGTWNLEEHQYLCTHNVNVFITWFCELCMLCVTNKLIWFDFMYRYVAKLHALISF